jgi:hypothetical protein
MILLPFQGVACVDSYTQDDALGQSFLAFQAVDNRKHGAPTSPSPCAISIYGKRPPVKLL